MVKVWSDRLSFPRALDQFDDRRAAQHFFAPRPERVTSGGLGPTVRRQVDPKQRTLPAARVASGPGQAQTILDVRGGGSYL
jgi:hypothetical protein